MSYRSPAMSEGPYREMPDVLGAAERAAEACVQLGKWRVALRTRVLLLFAAIGVVLAPFGYLVVHAVQAASVQGPARIYMNVFGSAVPFVAMLLLGRSVARELLHRRTPAVIARLAGDYQVPAAELAEIAALSEF